MWDERGPIVAKLVAVGIDPTRWPRWRLTARAAFVRILVNMRSCDLVDDAGGLVDDAGAAVKSSADDALRATKGGAQKALPGQVGPQKAVPPVPGGGGKHPQFTSHKSMLAHFEKHAGQIMQRSGRSLYSLGDYLADTQRVIDTGTRVTFTSGPHVGSTNFVRFAGSDRRGRAIMELVGLSEGGKVTTFTFKSARQLERWGMQVF